MKAKKINIIACLFLSVLFFTCGSDESDNTVEIIEEEETNEEVVECTTTGTVDQSTIAEIETMREAMVDFRSSLSSDLLAEASVCLDDERFYLWHNTPANDGNRDGITYGDLTDTQLEDFKAILQLFLSEGGYQKVYEITELSEGWLNNVMSSVWNPDFYSIDLFGDPETSGSWGFQLDGHHCVVNFLVHGDNISIVPAFLGGEPSKDTWNGEAFDIFSDEKDLAIALFEGMSEDELSSSVTNSSTRALEVGPADKNGDTDPYIGAYDYSGFEVGLKYADMSTETKANTEALMKEFVYNLSTTFADVWWEDIATNLDDTYFVWVYESGVTPSATSEFYFRIYNPYLWAEFNTEEVTGANANSIDDWNHVHSITRIPNNPSTDNGGDYGIFALMINQDGPKTLYEHYALADHHKLNTINFDYKVIEKKAHSHDHGHGHHGHSHDG